MTPPHPALPGSGRERDLQQLQEQTFDLLVIGGGINGAGIARDAAMRGLRVALVEKGDFASGTSSKSSKLIHGGIRYLQQGDLRLVRVHLVRPLAFLFPVYRGDPVGFLALGVGMWVYDLLAVFRNIRAHRMLTAKRVTALEPGLRSAGLRGAGFYYDCFTDDARLTLETVLAAKEEGAVAVNYLALNGFVKEGDRIVGASVHDRFGATPIKIQARCVVNATGPWADQVRRLDDETAAPCLRLTKGVHIIVPRERVGNLHAVVMHSPRDKRVLFVLPWGSHSLIGTTDTDFAGSPDDVRADDDDCEYLLETANWFFPRAGLRRADIISTYAGLRPLVADSDGGDPSTVSREEAVFESPSGLITLAGGKLTTYRFVAQEIVDLALSKLGRAPEARRPTRSQTARKPLPGGLRGDPHEIAKELLASNGFGLTREQILHLVCRYGSRAPDVLALVQSNDELNRLLVSGMPDIWAEAAYAAKTEMALEPEDVLIRRTNVGLKDPAEAAQIVDIVKEKLFEFRGGR
jgi:glycerol-3-phosphate dehydrogenase